MTDSISRAAEPAAPAPGTLDVIVENSSVSDLRIIVPA
jgi:hypothetical protein